MTELVLENTDESKARIENIEELISKVVEYESTTENPDLAGFLEDVALVADIDSLNEDSDYVVLMTIHSAKGLEFPQFVPKTKVKLKKKDVCVMLQLQEQRKIL